MHMKPVQAARLIFPAMALAIGCGEPAHDASLGPKDAAVSDGPSDPGIAPVPDAGIKPDATVGGADGRSDMPSTDVGLIADARPDGTVAADGPSCTNLTNKAAAVPLDAKSGGMPASYKPQGGPVSDGLYELTKAEAFGVPPLDTFSYQTFRLRYAIRISGSATAMDMVATVDVGGRSESLASSFTLSTSDKSWTRTQTCPTAAPAETAGYTATAIEIRLYDQNAAYVFTKR